MIARYEDKTNTIHLSNEHSEKDLPLRDSLSVAEAKDLIGQLEREVGSGERWYEEKSRFVRMLELNEDELLDNTSPLALMEESCLPPVMKQALEAGLCQMHHSDKWWDTKGKTNFAIRLAPDWRERLEQKGGAV